MGQGMGAARRGGGGISAEERERERGGEDSGSGGGESWGEGKWRTAREPWTLFRRRGRTERGRKDSEERERKVGEGDS